MTDNRPDPCPDDYPEEQTIIFDGSEDPLAAARHAILYRDADTALETFTLFDAVDTIMESIRTGVSLDPNKQQALDAYFRATQYPARTELVDGEFVHYDENGEELRRSKATQEEIAETIAQEERHKRWLARQAAEATLVNKRAGAIVAEIEQQLAENPNAGVQVSKLLKKGRNEEGVSLSERERGAFEVARAQLAARGLQAVLEMRRVGPDGSADHPNKARTHSLYSLSVQPLHPAP